MADVEDELVAEFREALAKEMEAGGRMEDVTNDKARNPDSTTVCRFLRARKNKVAAAIEQYAKAMVWRQEAGADTILDAPDPDEEVFGRICPHSNHGFDKEGRPIYVEKSGQIDVNQLLKELGPDKIIRRHVRQMEVMFQRAAEESKRRGTDVTSQVVIQDLKHVSIQLNPGALNLFKATVRIDQDFYPETLGHAFFINCPWIFYPVWAVLKPFMDSKTVAKFHVLGSSYQQELLKYIPADQLPKEYGGTCECEGGCVVGPSEKPGYVRPGSDDKPSAAEGAAAPAKQQTADL